MKINDAKLVISAVGEKQYPESGRNEFVLLGRSNVGKSSFINTLISRKALARTSSQPGKTQTMNFYDIDTEGGDFTFVDMPGYGYAKVSKKERAKWGRMIEEYLLKREQIANVFLLVDSRVGPTEDDKLMYDWLAYYDLAPVVIATKSDKLNKSKFNQAMNKIRKDLGMEEGEILIPFSATTKRGYNEAWEEIVSKM